MRKVAMMLALGAAFMAPSPLAADSARRDKAVETVPAPPPGMGQVVFYRRPNMGTLIGCRVSEDGEVVNRLPHGKYFVHPATPGTHQYEIKSDLVRVEVKLGETEYVRCTIVAMGLAELALKDRVDFDRHVRGLKLLPPWTGEKDKDD